MATQNQVHTALNRTIALLRERGAHRAGYVLDWAHLGGNSGYALTWRIADGSGISPLVILGTNKNKALEQLETIQLSLTTIPTDNERGL